MKLKLVNITMVALLSLGLMSSAMADSPLTLNQPNKPSSADRPVNQEKFAERKQEILNRMDQRRSCVANAQNPSEMKNCHKGDGSHRMGPRDGGGNKPEGRTR